MKLFKLFGIVLLSVGFTQISVAQMTPEKGSLGLRASIGGQNTIEVPYMFNEDLSLAPFIGFSTTQNASTNFSIGVMPRYYIGGSENLTTYATGTLGFQNTSFNNTNNSVFDVNLGVGFGAEYFFDNSFSIRWLFYLI